MASEAQMLYLAKLETVGGRIVRGLQERLDELERGALEAGRLRPNNEGDTARYTHAIGEVRDALELVVTALIEGIDETWLMGPGKPMEMEWLAWRHVCVELEKNAEELVADEGSGKGAVVDVNGPQFVPVISAIRRWGEELVGLRLIQGAPMVTRALSEARESYPEGGVPIE